MTDEALDIRGLIFYFIQAWQGADSWKMGGAVAQSY